MKIKYIVLTVIIVAVSFIGYSYYQSNKNNDKYIIGKTKCLKWQNEMSKKF